MLSLIAIGGAKAISLAQMCQGVLCDVPVMDLHWKVGLLVLRMKHHVME